MESFSTTRLASSSARQHRGNVAETTVDQLMSPIRSVISVTQSLEEAARAVNAPHSAAVLMNLSHQPVGLITDARLAAAVAQDPERWKRRRCACLVQPATDFLSPCDSIQEVLGRYRSGNAVPLLVLDGTRPRGVLHPDSVFAWCVEQRVSVFCSPGPISGMDDGRQQVSPHRELRADLGRTPGDSLQPQ